jgi:hypothetical protein
MDIESVSKAIETLGWRLRKHAICRHIIEAYRVEVYDIPWAYLGQQYLWGVWRILHLHRIAQRLRNG